jgi:hypothetical protein
VFARIHRVTVNRVLMHFRKAVRRYELTTEDGVPPPEKVEVWAEEPGHASADRVALETALG